MKPIALIFTVIERLAALAPRAIAAAQRGDAKAVDEILPPAGQYPDDHAYHRVVEDLERDYGPRP